MSGEEKDVAEKDNESKFFSRLKLGLKKTRDSFASGVIRIVSGPTELGPELWQELEEVLLSADMGVPTMTWIMEALKKEVRESPGIEKGEIVKLLKELLLDILEGIQVDTIYPSERPCIVMVIGINGSGKTTTIGKLAARYKTQGEQVMVAAGDTFRAAATEQLQAWAKRVDVPCVSQKSGADPSAVAYDAVSICRNKESR